MGVHKVEDDLEDEPSVEGLEHEHIQHHRHRPDEQRHHQQIEELVARPHAPVQYDRMLRILRYANAALFTVVRPYWLDHIADRAEVVCRAQVRLRSEDVVGTLSEGGRVQTAAVLDPRDDEHAEGQEIADHHHGLLGVAQRVGVLRLVPQVGQVKPEEQYHW